MLIVIVKFDSYFYSQNAYVLILKIFGFCSLNQNIVCVMLIYGKMSHTLSWEKNTTVGVKKISVSFLQYSYFIFQTCLLLQLTGIAQMNCSKPVCALQYLQSFLEIQIPGPPHQAYGYRVGKLAYNPHLTHCLIFCTAHKLEWYKHSLMIEKDKRTVIFCYTWKLCEV